MITDRIKEAVKTYCKNKYNRELKDNGVIGMIRDNGILLSDTMDNENRWWNDHLIIKDFEGVLVKYIDGKTTTDDSAEECGFEFDPNSIEEMEEYETTITAYRPRSKI